MPVIYIYARTLFLYINDGDGSTVRNITGQSAKQTRTARRECCSKKMLHSSSTPPAPPPPPPIAPAVLLSSSASIHAV